MSFSNSGLDYSVKITNKKKLVACLVAVMEEWPELCDENGRVRGGSTKWLLHAFYNSKGHSSTQWLCGLKKTCWIRKLKPIHVLQVELTGSSIFDYVHQADHTELAEQLGVSLAHQQRISSSNSSHHSSPLHGVSDNPSGVIPPGVVIPGGSLGGVGGSAGGQSPAIPDGKPCK